MDRATLFQQWLIDLTPQKMELLVRLEKCARMVTHVKYLTGENDEKLITGLVKASDELRGSYEDKPVKREVEAK